MAQRPYSFELKSIDDKSGTFSGYASTFNGDPDSYGDVITRGAFGESLREHERKGSRVALLWNHDVRQPIGVWTAIKEDESGLRVQGRLTLEVARAREALALMKDGALQGLSIGFQTLASEPRKGGGRLLKKIKLWEVSLVVFPANQGARVLSVNSNDIQTIRDYEGLLTDVGFSRSKAKILAQAWTTPNATADEGSRARAKQLAEGLRVYASKIEKSQERKDAKHT